LQIADRICNFPEKETFFDYRSSSSFESRRKLARTGHITDPKASFEERLEAFRGTWLRCRSDLKLFSAPPPSRWLAVPPAHAGKENTKYDRIGNESSQGMLGYHGCANGKQNQKR
jgi:hypothetical protein